MKLLIDIGHPGHVHLFRPLAQKLISEGDQVYFTCREKEFEKELLQAAGLPFTAIGKKRKSLMGKTLAMFRFTLNLWMVAIGFKPDMLLSHGSPYAAWCSFLVRKPHIALEDTGNMEQVRLYLPFTEYVLTSTAFHKKLGIKQLFYSGYHELAYLHPNQFKPDPGIRKVLGLEHGEKYVLLRFISWNATHDVGVTGLDLEKKLEIVDALKRRVRVFISSEGPLPKSLESLRIQIAPEKMHDVLSHAQFLFGESGTMTSEAGVLGTPAIQISGLPKGAMGTLQEQEDYGLVKVYSSYQPEILSELLSILDSDTSIYEARREKMLNEKADLTEILAWFIRGFPNSAEQMKQNKWIVQH